MKKEVLTLKEYQGFQKAYDFFNRILFAGSLPQVLVTLQRHANTRGYFSPERFKGRVENAAVHELALNPDTFTGRTDELILSTLTHEMCHVWQETYGEPSRQGYHNREWAMKMREVGLQPTTTGEPGGKETGQAVTHYILPDGRYAQAFAKLADTGFQLRWQSLPFGPNIAKLSHGATCGFSSPERRFEGRWGENFAEKEAWSLRKEAAGVRMLIETRLSNSS
jgi:SprT-like family